MYRNLNIRTLGISGRQSELIELALTYGFKGISVDIAQMSSRAANYGVEHVCRFHKSAEIQIGTFELPSTWQGPDDQFAAYLNNDLLRYLEIARELGAKQAVIKVEPGSDSLPYHDNFELHRQRIGKIADALAADDIRLGLGIRAARPVRQGLTYQFVFQADDLLTLIKTIAAPNVGLWFDSWNWKVGGGTLEQFKEIPVDQLVAVDLADAPADVDLAEIDEQQRMLPGAGGAIDCQEIVNTLRDAEYQGPVTPAPHRMAIQAMTRDDIVHQASRALESLWQGAGLSRAIVPIAAAAPAEEELPEELVGVAGEAEGEAETEAEATGEV